ncbi:amidase [Marmoricola sp. URHB0036]|uniref:amidase n=1 Tax=Marmoricola sp. URHB0036 TaxID=1298863 RepID=UPI0009DBC28A|nr:amidase [Marmoricola sp. URHB0036]
MNSNGLAWTPAYELASLIRRKELSVPEIAESLIEHVANVNPKLNAIVSFDPDAIRADATRLDSLQETGGSLGPIHGVPYTIKDMTDVAGLPTTSGLLSRKNHRASQDAVVVSRLKEAGGLFLGKTNVPEMSYYGGTDNHLFGVTHNPWKHGRTAGGSSGGAAAAVAAGMGQLAQGSDGCGSIRIPAAMCGVVGLKPTTGVTPSPSPLLDWSYDGPITRTVADNALMLDVMAGPHTGTFPSAHRVESSYFNAALPDIKGLRVAWSADLGLGVHVDPEVARIARGMADTLADLGADVTEAAPAWENASIAMWEGLWVPAYAGLLSHVDIASRPGDYDERLREIKAQGERLPLAAWGTAYMQRVNLYAHWDDFMTDFDILVSPTLASAAFPVDQFAPSWLEGASLREELLDWLLTYPFNMINNPAISIPAGFTDNGCPVGLQISARHWEDARILGVARTLEEARPWAAQKPVVGRQP